MENSRTDLIRGGRGRWRTAAILAFALLACIRNAPSGDILRGGATSSGAPTGAGAGGPTSGAAAAAAAKDKASDRLARTTQAITAVRKMQSAPPPTSIIRPNVPNGLQTGGLKVATGANANWTGAKAPQQQGSTVYIKQKESEAILHWETFNVGAGTTVRYDQSSGGSDSGDWIAFNRVFDPTGKPSQILGKIRAEGQVYIINQNGIVFGAGSQVNTRTLVASSLPVNDNLIELGLLNNRDAQFLFSALPVPGGSDGTPAFIPPPPVNGVIGDVVVEAGALIESPVNADGNGGRVMLVGPNVRNDGIISTPKGQTILAAGLQVGVAAHNEDDPSLRGLDVWVGSVGSYDGAATNNGLIESLQGSIIMAGKAVNQMGVINSSTDVDLNGRIDLLASYGAVGNPNFDSKNGAGSGGPVFLNQYTGVVTLGKNSVTMVLPNYGSTKTIPGVSLPENSQINIQGGTVSLQQNSIVMAPSGDIHVRAGRWPYVDKDGNGTTLNASGAGEAGLERFYEGTNQIFLLSSGQIFLEPGALIDASGTTDVFVALAQNLVTVQLRGFELADMPLQRDSEIRGISLIVDLRVTGQYGGETWYGTPLGDLSGIVDVIQSNVSQLTTSGGTVTMEAGDSIILQPGSTVDVSGGYYRYEGGFVRTTRLVRGPNIIGIEDATPNVLYDGVYTGQSNFVSEKWGVSKSYSHPLAPTGGYTQQEYIQGANGGTINLNAPTLLLGGELMGQVVQGPRQQDSPPELASLNLSFTADKMIEVSADNIQFLKYSPFAPLITVTNEHVASTFLEPAKNGAWPAEINPELREEFQLSTSLYTEGGFGNITIENSDGDFVVPAGTIVSTPPGGSLAVEARNVFIEGSIIAPGGDISFTAYNYSPYVYAEQLARGQIANMPLPLPDPSRGIITVSADSVLSTAGLFIDERPGTTTEFGSPHVLDGGSIALEAYTINLEEGSVLDVSGGVLAKATGKFSHGDGGDISILAGRDPKLTDLIGGELHLGSKLLGYSVGTGGSLTIQAQLIQIGGGASSDGRMFAVEPEFFQQGGFSNYALTGIGALNEATGEYTPAVRVVAGTTIEPRTESWIITPYQSPNGQLGVTPYLKPVGLRPPASISLSGLGADDPFTTSVVEAVGLVVLEEGTRILTDPGAQVEVQGEAVAVLGEIRAPGGKILISGADKYPLAPDLQRIATSALPTVYIGPNAVLSAAGTAVLVPDPYGRRSGYLYPGGTIKVSGNIVAETGALLDVSGASAILDFHPSRLAANGFSSVPLNAGLNSTPWQLRTVPVQVDSNGGLIVLRGGQMLYSNATLLGEAGGPTALGGTLAVSSGRFYPDQAIQTGADINLIVEQTGNGLEFGNTARFGNIVSLMSGASGFQPAFETVENGGIGYFAIDQFSAGGFDSLDLGFEYRENASPIPFGGNVEFRGPIVIEARGSVRLAGGGVVMADSPVSISASYIAIGQEFRPPTGPDDPFIPFTSNNPFDPGAYNFPATSGPGSLNLTASLIDIGTVSMQGIGNATFTAVEGDIRGNGTLEIAGDLTLAAAQVYPTTLADFNIFAFDRNIVVAAAATNSSTVTLASQILPPGFGVGSPLLGSTVIAINGTTVTLAGNANTSVSNPTAFVYDPGSGSVQIVQYGHAETPLSVGGNLAIYASQISQEGTLRAPLGSITLGWDGTDIDPTDADLDRPVSPISGDTLSVPTALQVTLAKGSMTSVSALDLVGKPMLIPYGLSPDGLSWIDPRGINVTTSGLPEKSIVVAGNKVKMQAGATIDIRGGGDLLAFRWVQDNGGTVDLLGTAVLEWSAAGSYTSGDLVTYNGQTWSARVAIDSTNFANAPAPGSSTRYWTLVPESYAVVPGFASSFAPYNPFNPAAGTLGGDPGFVSSSLGLGDQIYLDAGSGLPAGYYTLLPKRYAIMPGAFLITPQEEASLSTDLGPLRPVNTPDGATYVTGYRFNAFNSPEQVSPVRSLYEVASPAVVQGRVDYDFYLANTFMPEAAARLGLEQPQRIPNDSGYLAFSGNNILKLEGSVLTTPGGANGRGASIDIASFQDIYIVGGDGSAPLGATVVLNAALLNSWGAESLLIGGLRYKDSDGVHVDVRAPSVTLDNPGSVLEGSDITLVANTSLVITDGSAISSTRTGSQPVDTFLIEGDGALLRVGSNPGSGILRSNVTGDPSVSMVIGAGAEISGISVILDSTYATSLDETATIDARALQLGSGQISIVLSDPAGGLTGSVISPHLVLQGDVLADVQNSRQLTLLSYTSIDVYGAGSFGNDGLRSISFLSGGIRGYEQNGGSAVFSADRIVFGNPVDVAALPAPGGPLSGTLQFDASTIQFGDNDFAVTGYQGLVMNAPGGVLGAGKGTFSTAGDLSIFSPLITGVQGSTLALTAGGNMLLENIEGKSSLKGGLGASFTFTADSITANSAIYLPSGLLTLRATFGDVVVGGNLSVEGTAKKFYDITRFADAGGIVLTSDAGNVSLLEGSTISVAGAAEGGNAGALAVNTAAGTFTSDGTLVGTAAEGYKSGSFLLDVGSMPLFADLGAILAEGGFFESVGVRVRNGDVLISGETKAHHFALATDRGGITVDGLIDASGITGGSISLMARDSVTLAPTSILTVAAQQFSNAGKGGSVRIEAGAAVDGVSNPLALVDIQAGSLIDLSVAEYAKFTPVDTSLGALPDYQQVGTAAFYGLFQGTLHIRAPQTAGGDNLQVGPILGTINGASSILVEGYRLWDLTYTGGQLTNTGSVIQAGGGVVVDANVNIQQSIRENGNTFGANSEAIKTSLFSGDNAALADRAVVTAGAEIINRAGASPVSLSLGVSGVSTVSIPSGGGTVVFPLGTGGDNMVQFSTAVTVVSPTGVKTTLAANTPISLAAGSSVVASAAATVSYVSGSGGPIQMQASSGSSYTVNPSTVATVNSLGSRVSLNTPGSSAISLDAGSSVLFTVGTPGTRQVVSSVDGTITSSTGVVTNLTAGVATSIAAGSTVSLSTAGTITYAATGSGTGTPTVSLLAGSFSTGGAVSVTASTGDLTLGTPTSLANADWDLSGFRYGPDLTPGMLTLRAAGDLVFNNTLSDGFTPVANTAANGNSTMWLAPLMAINPLLPTNLQSWSFNLTAGADLGAADHGTVLAANLLAPGKGSVLVGQFYPAVPNSSSSATGLNGLTANSIRISTTAADQGTRYEVIRTGTGDIEINAALDVQLRNQFATIYTAGVAIPTSVVTSIYSQNDFVIPIVVRSAAAHPPQGSLGAPQQNYAPQWSLAGGNVAVSAQGDIWHSTMVNGEIVVDSSRQTPNNWLYRRGYVDADTGVFGVGGVDFTLNPVVDAAASTTWWIDFSNFFEGVGALGGGDVTLIAGDDIINIDAFAPTNARMPGRVQNPDLTFSNVKPDAGKLLELGGGDLVVRAGGDISGGIYYVERGEGTLFAGGDITTNASRSPSLGTLASESNPAVLDPLTWLPTTLFVGKSSFQVGARGDILLGPVTNPFLLPQGLNNKFWYKTYFNTFSEDAGVEVTSFGGSVTHRLAVTLPGVLQPGGQATSQPILAAWLGSQNLYSGAGSAGNASNFQPWLRLSELSVESFNTLFTLAAPSLHSTAFGGDVNIVGTMNLFPSPTGNIELAASGNIVGLQPSGVTKVLDTQVTVWTSAIINLSDASPGAVPGIASPLAYQALVGRELIPSRLSSVDPFVSINKLFQETGSYTGAAAAADVKQSLHDPKILHSGDTNPVRIYAAEGDVTGFTLFTPKFTQIAAGNDIADVSFYIQNVDDGDISIVTAGRDIIPSDENSPLRSQASDLLAGNVTTGDPLPGDIQINGPGTLEVLAGRNIDLGTGPNLGDGTGTGITSVGRSRNPALDIEGADLVILAGVKGADGGAALGLSDSNLDIDGFIDAYGMGIEGSKQMSDEEQAIAALNVLFGILEASASTGNYDEAFAAIGTLFGSGAYEGEIMTRSRDIRTVSGGSITMMAPGGSLTMSSDIIGNPLTPPGIVTEFGGGVDILTAGSVDIGAARIFTLRGGDLTIWSSEGDIAAGTAPKTVVTAPPTRVAIDANSADVQTDLGGLATGGGIGVLASVESVEPGNVYLIAPAGTVDAGDAGIRATGDITIAAVQVLNADNIAAGGQTTGVPAAPPAAVPNIAGMTSAANTTGAASSVAQEVANEAQSTATTEEEASVYTVEVLGYGGGEENEEEEENR
jgi:filamentous hemagglutinin